MSQIHSLNRRDMIKLGAAVAGGFVFPHSSQAGIRAAPQRPPGDVAAGVEKRDLILSNGKFMDGRGFVASALTIRNGRITNIGAERNDAKPAADVTMVDLRGRTVVPGLFDSHAHYARAGVNPGYEARRIERAFSIRELQETIARAASGVPTGAFITCVGGWNHLQFAEKRPPTKGELDAAAPDHAVYSLRNWRPDRRDHQQTGSGVLRVARGDGR